MGTEVMQVTKRNKNTCYCMNLKRCAQAAAGIYDEIMASAGLTSSQYYLLLCLFRLETANITCWAQYVGLDRSTMVRNIKVLQAHGWVEVTEGRGKTYKLSGSGKAVLKTAGPLWLQAQRHIEALLGKEDAAALLRISGKLHE